MGVITALAGFGSALRDAGSLAEVFVGNKAKLDNDEHAEFIAALNQLGAEFSQPRNTWFDSLINGLNRLPRPALAMGTLGLFVFSMVDPIGFASRMQGLALVPDPLWWLLGAIVSFYFGARELHYFRKSKPFVEFDDVQRVNELREQLEAIRPKPAQEPLEDDPEVDLNVSYRLPEDRMDPDFNAAVAEWRSMNRSA